MDLEGIMLSEISQTEKDKYYMISLVWNLRNKTDKPMGGEKKKKRERETNCKRLLKTENKLKVGEGREVGDGLDR